MSTSLMILGSLLLVIVVVLLGLWLRAELMAAFQPLALALS